MIETPLPLVKLSQKLLFTTTARNVQNYELNSQNHQIHPFVIYLHCLHKIKFPTNRECYSRFAGNFTLYIGILLIKIS